MYGTSTAHPLSLPSVKGESSIPSLQRCTTISSLSAIMPIEPYPIYHSAHHSNPNHTITKVAHLTATVTPCLTSHTTLPSKPPPQPSFTQRPVSHHYSSLARPTLCTHTPKPQQQHPSTRHSPPTQVNLTATVTPCLTSHTTHPSKPPPQPSSPHLPSHPNYPSTPPPVNTPSAIRHPRPFPSTSPASAGGKPSSRSSPPPLPLTQSTRHVPPASRRCQTPTQRGRRRRRRSKPHPPHRLSVRTRRQRVRSARSRSGGASGLSEAKRAR